MLNALLRSQSLPNISQAYTSLVDRPVPPGGIVALHPEQADQSDRISRTMGSVQDAYSLNSTVSDISTASSISSAYGPATPLEPIYAQHLHERLECLKARVDLVEEDAGFLVSFVRECSQHVEFASYARTAETSKPQIRFQIICTAMAGAFFFLHLWLAVSALIIYLSPHNHI